MQGEAPSIFPISRIKRFGLSSGMVKMLQDDAGDKAKHIPESSLEHCLKSGRHGFNHAIGFLASAHLAVTQYQ
jgi:hypothetical protein